MKIQFDYKIIDDISSSTFEWFYNEFKKWDRRKICNVLIFSSGGSAEAAAAIVDYIKTTNLKVDFYCFGQCESAATLIIKAGRRKYAAPNCMFMVHTPTAGNASIKAKIEHRKKVNHFNKIVAWAACGVKLKNTSTYLTAEEALEYGMIDEIL